MTVIGAGIVGVCCGLHLQRKGFAVTVVDRLPPGEATSYGNACMITDSSVVPLAAPGVVKSGAKMLLDKDGPLFIKPAYTPKLAPWLWRFARHGVDAKTRQGAKALAGLLRGALQDHHELADNTPATRWLSDEPSLFPYDSEAAFRAEAYSWELRRANGVRFEPVDGALLRELEPALNPRYRFGVLLPDHGKAVNPSKLTKAHAEWLRRNGGQVLQHEVREIEIADGKVKRVMTEYGGLDVDLLVIAAGAWSSRLSAKLGDRVPLEAEGGYHLTLTDPGVALNHPLLHSKYKVALAAMEQGVRIAGMAEFAGIQTATKKARTRLLLKYAKTILPAVQTEHYSEWRGNRPSTPDSLPVIGRSPKIGNVYYAFGNQHVGLSSGPKTGRLVAQLIAGEPPQVDLTPFRVDRF